MEAFYISTGIVALAEMGDKTQLLALVLAVRFRKPFPIIVGIFISTLLNHAFAGAIGAWLTSIIGKDLIQWIVGISFIIMAIWTLIPDKLENDNIKTNNIFGIFGITFIAFFLAEMGDKTQIATIALAARFGSFYSVVAGTTTGLLIANIPIVIFGEKISNKIPIKVLHKIASGLFLFLGGLTIANVLGYLK